MLREYLAVMTRLVPRLPPIPARGLDRLLTFNAADFRRYEGDIALEATEISGPAGWSASAGHSP